MAKATKYLIDDVIRIKGESQEKLWLIIDIQEDTKTYKLRYYDVSYYTKDLKLVKSTNSNQSTYRDIAENEIMERVYLDKNFMELSLGDEVTYLSRTGQYTIRAELGRIVNLSKSRVEIQTGKDDFNKVKSHNLVVHKFLF